MKGFEVFTRWFILITFTFTGTLTIFNEGWNGTVESSLYIITCFLIVNSQIELLMKKREGK